VGRCIHHRIVTWILNKSTRTVQTNLIVVLSYLIYGRFIVTAFHMLLFVFLFDFVTISLATDNVRSLGKPSTWPIFRLGHAAIILGVIETFEIFGCIRLGADVFMLNDDQLSTFAFQLIFYFAFITAFSVRERAPWWYSRPSGTLLTLVLVEIPLVVLVCSVGIGTSLVAVPYYYNLLTVGWAMFCVFGPNDVIKCLCFELLGIATPTTRAALTTATTNVHTTAGYTATASDPAAAAAVAAAATALSESTIRKKAASA